MAVVKKVQSESQSRSRTGPPKTGNEISQGINIPNKDWDATAFISKKQHNPLFLKTMLIKYDHYKPLHCFM